MQQKHSAKNIQQKHSWSPSAVGSECDCESKAACLIFAQSHTLMENDYEIISMFILFLLLISGGLLAVATEVRARKTG